MELIIQHTSNEIVIMKDEMKDEFNYEITYFITIRDKNESYLC